MPTDDDQSRQLPVVVERGPGVVTFRLNRPARLNAMSHDMLDLLLTGVEEVCDDPEVRVIVLTGAGRGFCAGGDLGGFQDDAATSQPPLGVQVGVLRRHMRVVELLRSSTAVSIGAVNGPCAGAGLGLALACDLRVCRDGAVFRTAFIDAALSGDFGGSWLLSRVLGEAKAKELYLLNDKVGSAEALRLGLVSAVYDEGSFESEVTALVDRLTAKPPIALRHMKSNLDDASRLGFSDACEAEARRHVASFRTDDLVEAAAAFVERRPPHFVGR
jgi:2-(1,2-epoxy-1,2-dihydrophenyl)acetyl-CoA isomerase